MSDSESRFVEYQRPSWLNGGLVAVGLVIAGCATPKMEPLPPPAHSSFPFSTNCAGLEIEVDPYFEIGRVKKLFGENLLSHRILPVRVAFRNSRQEGAYLLQPESMALLGAREGIRTTATVGTDLAAEHARRDAPYNTTIFFIALASPLAGAALGPLALTLQENRADALDVARHMESVRLQDRPLYPSDSNTGFLYFQLSGRNDFQSVAALRFQIRNMESREETTVIVPIKSN